MCKLKSLEKNLPQKSLRVKCKIWIEADNGVVFGGGRLALFQAIMECGSINQAAAKLGMSYRAAWGKITATEKHLGIKLVERHIGGVKSGSELTAEAKKIMEAYLQFKKEAEEAVNRLFHQYFDNL